MTNSLVWLAVWLSAWFTINTEWVCECYHHVDGRQYCKCALEMKP